MAAEKPVEHTWLNYTAGLVGRDADCLVGPVAAVVQWLLKPFVIALIPRTALPCLTSDPDSGP